MVKERTPRMATSEIRSPVVFDNDCLSSFLWTGSCGLVTRLLDKPILIPAQVISELDNLRLHRGCAWVRDSLEAYISDGRFTVADIDAGTPAAAEFVRLTEGSQRPIGSGEAAALILAHERKGTIASNNTRDVMDYCARFAIPHTTTRDIMCLCFEAGYISLAEAERIWHQMISRRRFLPRPTFSEAYGDFRNRSPQA